MTPAAQITVRVSMRSVSPSGPRIATDSASTSTTVWPTSGVAPSCSSDAGRLPRERLREARQDAVERLDEQHAGAPRVDVAKVAAQRVTRELGDLACHLDAGRAGADDDEREPGPPARQVGLGLGRLEGGEDAPADVEGAGERLELGRALLPVVVAEVRVVRTAGDDERVVADRHAPRRRSARSAITDAALEVEPGHLGEQHADVPLPLEHRAQRRGDLGRREGPGRHLVRQRLEEVEVLPVEERHLDRCPAQPAYRLEPAEATSDDDDAIGHRSGLGTSTNLT